MEDKKMMHEIEEALKKRAFGYEYEEVEMIASKNGQPGKIKKTKKAVPPDVNALYLLMKLQKEKQQEPK